jgi:UDP-N-acetylmuramoylalanine--D-glutamate ligase|tara:strand:+ start:233 stop:1261 length:1029 start_codon:yes stop_codon:yes gene_type:complete
VTSLIYGYGDTGKSFERYLEDKKIDFKIFDSNITEYNLNYNFQDFDKILCSPGVSKDIFENIKCQNTNIFTDVDIFFNEDRSIKIGITGTNRKSTTAFHLHQLFNKYKSSNLIGNIGNTMLDYINNGKEFSIIELSSFQLDKMDQNHLDFGILLNIEGDHLDYHGNFNAYKLAKEKILAANKSISFETDPYNLFKWITGKEAKKIQLKNLPYRFEYFSEKIINDSKSTNYHSLKYAMKKAKRCFNSEYILIVCGNPKKEKFREIHLKDPSEVYIFGKHSNQINKCIKHPKKKLFKNIKELFDFVHTNKSTCNLLFSPGYPSGDDFKDFKERGEIFNIHAINK